MENAVGFGLGPVHPDKMQEGGIAAIPFVRGWEKGLTNFRCPGVKGSRVKVPCAKKGMQNEGEAGIHQGDPSRPSGGPAEVEPHP